MTRQFNELVDMKAPSLTASQCGELAKACLLNAERLISSSRVLLHADDTAGSLAMLAVATHEMGRAALAANAMTVVQTPAYWRRFWFNFRSPKAGIRAMLNWERMATGETELPISPALRRLGGMEAAHKKLSILANYTRFSFGRPRLPEHLLTKEVLQNAQYVTGMRFVIMRTALGRLSVLPKPSQEDLLEACRQSHETFGASEGERASEAVTHLCSHVEFLADLGAQEAV